MELWNRTALWDEARNTSFRGYAYLWVLNAVLMSVRRKNYREATHISLTPPDQRGVYDKPMAHDDHAARYDVRDERPNVEQAKVISIDQAAATVRLRNLLRRQATQAAISPEDMALLKQVYLENDGDIHRVARLRRKNEAAMRRRVGAAVRALRRAVA